MPTLLYSAGKSSKKKFAVQHITTISYRMFTQSSKRPALARVFWIHLLEVCWTFAGSCKHAISYLSVRLSVCTLQRCM